MSTILIVVILVAGIAWFVMNQKNQTSALTACKDCGNEISGNAKSCPKCGAPQPKKTSLTTKLIAGFFALSVLTSIFLSNKEQTSENSIANESQVAKEHDNQKIELAETPKVNWLYDSSKDEMRGTTTKFANTLSTNTVDFDFPYNGGSNLLLTIRKKGNEIDIYLTITKGQMLCGISECETAFKFDNGAIQSITMSEPDNHSSETLFVAYDATEAKIINQLRKAKTLTVEVPFYQEGRKQFTFDVSGLEFN